MKVELLIKIQAKLSFLSLIIKKTSFEAKFTITRTYNINIPATCMVSFKRGLIRKTFLGLYPFFLWITVHYVFYLTKVRDCKPLFREHQINVKQRRQPTYVQHARAAIVAVEKQRVLHILGVQTGEK